VTSLVDNAKEAAEEAGLLFRTGYHGGACSRTYYAMFNMARALLLRRGHLPEEAKTHKSVLRLFSLEFVQTGQFEAQQGRALREAFDARQEADYEGGVAESEAARVMASMEEFMKTAERVLTETNSDKGN
jgi:uncharacterized protein (UPF0332 family)